jgi:hypothetical protein
VFEPQLTAPLLLGKQKLKLKVQAEEEVYN